MPKFDGYKQKDMATSDPIPEATYRVRVKDEPEYNDHTDPEWRKKHPQSEAKHPGLNCTFVVQDETVPNPEGGDDITVLGRHIFTNITMKKGADFMLRQLLEAIGYPEDDDLDTARLKDAECLAVVVIKPAREVNGQKYEARNEIKRFMSVYGDQG